MPEQRAVASALILHNILRELKYAKIKKTNLCMQRFKKTTAAWQHWGKNSTGKERM